MGRPVDAFSALFAALSGRCPNCGVGKLYRSFMTVADTCEHCHVRYERWEGSWTIPTVMGYATGAVFAVVGGGILLYLDLLEAYARPLIFATLFFTVLVYPVIKNFSLFMLWNNGFMTPDPPTLVTPDQPSDSAADSGRDPTQGNTNPSP